MKNLYLKSVNIVFIDNPSRSDGSILYSSMIDRENAVKEIRKKCQNNLKKKTFINEAR